ncbi:MAG: peptidoglycan bridge formation glycyltransferase FemA/FemB family protein [Clostridiales bacterium]|nr:peptidoglycan bridge formation glycyltransferase FemA/FemB family protein [Candidatus Crickella merdequi]
MEFIRNVDREEYEVFVSNHPTKSHFLQSYAWGEFQVADGASKVYYVGMKDDEGKLCATALIIEKKPSGFKPYLYCPRGYVLDYSDREVLATFTREITAFAKSVGAMFVTIDPDVERWEIDEKGKPVEGGFDNNWLIEYLECLGYQHCGYTMRFDGRQPRFTFRIDLNREIKAIEKSFTGNVMKNVKKSNNYASEVRKGSAEDIKILHDMLTLTGERDNFTDFPLDYYQTQYDILSKYDMATLFIGYTYPAETVRKLEASLEELLAQREKIKKPGPLKENMEREPKIRREIELFKNYAEKYPDGVALSAHFVIHYGDKAWAVHAGSTLELSETFLNNRVYHDKIIAMKERGCAILDQFGTVGDWENSDLKSLHEFKKQFGGRYVEFIGEFNLITDKKAYFMYKTIRPLYRKVLKVVRTIKK